MTTPPVPVRPNPYVAPGTGWLFKVKVPAHGVWQRRPTQVSQTWTVYENTKVDYHVTISSAFLTNYSAALDTHVTSNVPIDGRTVHWPLLPGTNPTAPQQQWLADHGTAGFNALIAAFSQQLLSCAANIAPSRAYDTAVAQRRQAMHADAASRRASSATYQSDVESWLNACPPDAYKEAFRAGQTYYFLDPDQGVVLRLDPPPLPIKQGSGGLNPGFVNKCKELTTVTPMQPAQWALLDDGLVLLRVAKRDWAMLKTDFDACQPAGDLLSLDQLVDLAVDGWAQTAAASKQYDTIAANDDQMNVSGPDRARFHLQIADLLDGVQLKSHGLSRGLILAPPMHPDDLPDGMYRQESAVDLRKSLPQVLRIRRGTAVSYIFPDKLKEGWAALENVNVIDAAQLAENLIKYQLYAENLKVGDDAGLIVYLWPRGGGSPLFAGLKDKVAPGAAVSKSCVLALNERGVRDLCKAMTFTVLEPGQAATSQDVIVICDGSGKLSKSPVFVSKSAMVEFNYQQAKEAYKPIQQAAEQQEAQAKAKAQAEAEAAARSYPAAWNLLAADTFGLTLYKNPADGAIIAVASGDARPGHIRIGSVSVRKEDKKLTPTSKLRIRYLKFSAGNDQSKLWCTGLIEHVRQVAPTPPSGIGKYLLSLEQ